VNPGIRVVRDKQPEVGQVSRRNCTVATQWTETSQQPKIGVGRTWMDPHGRRFHCSLICLGNNAFRLSLTKAGSEAPKAPVRYCISRPRRLFLCYPERLQVSLRISQPLTRVPGCYHITPHAPPTTACRVRCRVNVARHPQLSITGSVC
jgi:hypothetical protein